MRTDEILESVCADAGLHRTPLLCRVPQNAPIAITIGGGNAAAIVGSDSLLRAITGRAMRGVLAHEIVHLRNGDLAFMRLAMVAGRLTRVLSQVALMLVFLDILLRAMSARGLPLPPLLVLAATPLGASLLQLALSRAGRSGGRSRGRRVDR